MGRLVSQTTIPTHTAALNPPQKHRQIGTSESNAVPDVKSDATQLVSPPSFGANSPIYNSSRAKDIPLTFWR